MAIFQFGSLALVYTTVYLPKSLIPSISSWDLDEFDDRRTVLKICWTSHHLTIDCTFVATLYCRALDL